MIGCLILAITASKTQISIFPGQVVRSFVPDRFFGAGIDGSDRGSVERTFRPHNLEAMKMAGLRSLTLRLRTELAGEAWHWNPQGMWSDPARSQGYWTGSSIPDRMIDRCWGYRLPRRGNTFDQANDDGYSKISDGDPSTFWKSNPYLDPVLAGSDRVPPQWVVIDLKRHVSVNTMHIRWANPYAVRFRVEFWSGEENVAENDNPAGLWRTFQQGVRTGDRGGEETIDLGRTENVRFVRLILLQSSYSAEPNATADRRDRMGFAIREIEIGKRSQGVLRDAIRHEPKRTQTPFYVSSTDPWHRSEDLDPDTEQPGFDLVARSGLAYDRPMLIPVPVLYDTPENASAEIKWLKARRYPIRGVEVGEEPDGQFVDPAHYAILYTGLAKRLRLIEPKISLGGPCFQTALFGDDAWPDNRPTSWMRRWIDAMKRSHSLRLLDFFSFEWYPFDRPFGDATKDLRRNPIQLRQALETLKQDGLPPNLPWSITEYGYSAYAGPNEVDLQAGLLNLDTVGQALQLGAEAAYLYGYEPSSLISDYPNQWGNLTTWLTDNAGNAKCPLPTLWAAKMMTSDWCLHGSTPHRLIKAISSDSSVAVYAVVRPDHVVSILLLNKSAEGKAVDLFVGGRRVNQAKSVQFGRSQYAWQEAGPAGRPLRSLPPSIGTWKRGTVLPPLSTTVVQVRSA